MKRCEDREGTQTYTYSVNDNTRQCQNNNTREIPQEQRHDTSQWSCATECDGHHQLCTGWTGKTLSKIILIIKHTNGKNSVSTFVRQMMTNDYEIT